MTNNNSQCETQVLINGKPIKEYYHEGRHFVEARENQKYTIKLKNNSCNRILGIVSVDGIDVISGKSASDNSGGYVLSPYSSLIIEGFRISDMEVNAFEFSKKEKSYASKNEETGFSTGSCGVIGVKYISEKLDFYYYQYNTTPNIHNYPYNIPKNHGITWESGLIGNSLSDCGTMRSIKAQNLGASSQNIVNCFMNYSTQCLSEDSVDFDMGTKFSNQKIESKVTTTEFKRGNIITLQEIYYASRKTLEKIGIVFNKEPQLNFPSSFPGNIYCKPPKK